MLKRTSVWANTCFHGGIIKSLRLDSPLCLISLVNNCLGSVLTTGILISNYYGLNSNTGPEASCWACLDMCLHCSGLPAWGQHSLIDLQWAHTHLPTHISTDITAGKTTTHVFVTSENPALINKCIIGNVGFKTLWVMNGFTKVLLTHTNICTHAPADPQWLSELANYLLLLGC